MRFCLLILFAISWTAFNVDAAVVRLEISEQVAVGGGYERLKGKAFFAVDPQHPRNRQIVDLQKAPTNSSGLVEFSADFYSLRPVGTVGSNRTILFEVVNRGKKGMLQMFSRAAASADPQTELDFGDGLLLKQGYSLVWLGWQHDVPPSDKLMRLYAPVAKGVTGTVRSEFTPNAPVDHFSLGDLGHVPYPLVQPQSVKLTVRDDIYGSRTNLPPDAWHLEGSEVHLALPAIPGKLYEVVYESRDPVVAGLGLASIRDLISYLKREWPVDRAIGFGISQSAMVLRALLFEGFNADERDRQVFDGIFAHVAGARRATFQRFSQASRTAGPLRNASLSTTEQGPYTDAGLLKRAQQDKVIPKIFYTNSTYEYWGSAASLLHTSEDGERDIELPPTTRMYMFAGGQHGPAAFPPSSGTGGRNLPNFNDYRWMMRPLLARLQQWISADKEPETSVYPTLAAKTLVPFSAYTFKRGEKPAIIHTPHVLNFGPDYLSKGVVTLEPPRVQRAYFPRVPQADANGNDLGGLRMPELECSIAAYTGWNLRSERIGASSYLLGNTGSYVPFSNAEISKKFSDEAEYRSCVEHAAASLSKRGFLDAVDIPEVVKTATRHWKWRMSQTPSSELIHSH